LLLAVITARYVVAVYLESAAKGVHAADVVMVFRKGDYLAVCVTEEEVDCVGFSVEGVARGLTV